ncbi:GM11539 [Drosophila sechellia]|uniref:GM11539 n=1 Tax=Drosophila sechellia TaxID=7238 RepID=B4IGI4_DROSE|nr:GM11539 [Drosophila sechellia]
MPASIIREATEAARPAAIRATTDSSICNISNNNSSSSNNSICRLPISVCKMKHHELLNKMRELGKRHV